MAQKQVGTTTAVYNKRYYNSRGQILQIRVGTQADNENLVIIWTMAAQSCEIKFRVQSEGLAATELVVSSKSSK
jgi:hypothetical protein